MKRALNIMTLILFLGADEQCPGSAASAVQPVHAAAPAVQPAHAAAPAVQSVRAPRHH